MKTGDILLVHTKNHKLSQIIQHFQMKQDEKAGYYNHSGILYEGRGRMWVFEATQLPGRKVRAAATFTPLDYYTYRPDDYELLFLPAKDEPHTRRFEDIIMRYNATPYDYKNLLFDQIIQYVFGKWIGRMPKRAAKRMVCHELTMKIWDEYKGIFPDWNRARVADIYHSKHFDKVANVAN